MFWIYSFSTYLHEKNFIKSHATWWRRGICSTNQPSKWLVQWTQVNIVKQNFRYYYELMNLLLHWLTKNLCLKGNLIYILQSLEGVIYIFRHNERNSKIKLLIYKIMNSSISLKSLNQRRTYKFQTFDLRNQLLKELKWPDFLSIIWKLLSITWLDKLLPGKKRFSLSSWKYRISPLFLKTIITTFIKSC